MTSIKSIFEVTAVILKKDTDKPSMKWNFLTDLFSNDKISGIKDLEKEIRRHNFDDRIKGLGIKKFRQSFHLNNMDKLRFYRAEYGQGVRQLTVRNMSTKDNPSTMPLHVYTEGLKTQN